MVNVLYGILFHQKHLPFYACALTGIRFDFSAIVRARLDRWKVNQHRTFCGKFQGHNHQCMRSVQAAPSCFTPWPYCYHPQRASRFTENIVYILNYSFLPLFFMLPSIFTSSYWCTSLVMVGGACENLITYLPTAILLGLRNRKTSYWANTYFLYCKLV